MNICLLDAEDEPKGQDATQSPSPRLSLESQDVRLCQREKKRAFQAKHLQVEDEGLQGRLISSTGLEHDPLSPPK